MRAAKIQRNTKETRISGELKIEGRGRYQVSTGIRFLDHMLELFAKHGYDAVCVDLRAHGQSAGWYTSFGAHEKWDMVALLDTLGRRGVNVSRVGVLGHSLGAATALQWARPCVC